MRRSKRCLCREQAELGRSVPVPAGVHSLVCCYRPDVCPPAKTSGIFLACSAHSATVFADARTCEHHKGARSRAARPRFPDEPRPVAVPTSVPRASVLTRLGSRSSLPKTSASGRLSGGMGKFDLWMHFRCREEAHHLTRNADQENDISGRYSESII